MDILAIVNSNKEIDGVISLDHLVFASRVADDPKHVRIVFKNNPTARDLYFESSNQVQDFLNHVCAYAQKKKRKNNEKQRV
jgi:hypothetical protein